MLGAENQGGTHYSKHDYLGGPPHPVIVTIGDSRDYIRVLLYSYYTTITGWRVLLNDYRLKAHVYR